MGFAHSLPSPARGSGERFAVTPTPNEAQGLPLSSSEELNIVVIETDSPLHVKQTAF